ncbi:hypothetical protein WR25_06890 [Diploscapter pachys]|uniref:C2H2-type domain-containing protein n=1 Tax=Diploscapter pachys TaxID=2018661 RepID=A0A2A2L445_9BILA|nr:hypothetical protein WR25_06890 [Diploscapter pachys]
MCKNSMSQAKSTSQPIAYQPDQVIGYGSYSGQDRQYELEEGEIVGDGDGFWTDVVEQEPEVADYVPQIDQFVRHNPTEDVRWYSIENDLYKGYDFNYFNLPFVSQRQQQKHQSVSCQAPDKNAIALPMETEDELQRAIQSIEIDEDYPKPVVTFELVDYDPYARPTAPLILGMKVRVKDDDQKLADKLERRRILKGEGPIAKVFRPMDEVTIDKKTQIKRKLFAKLGLKVPYTISEEENPMLSRAFQRTYCHICKQNFSSAKMLFMHKIHEHGEKAIPCPICHTHFRTKASLDKHHKEVHVIQGRRSLHTHMSRHRSEHGGLRRSNRY